jgi:hypothetical protein
MGRRRKMYSEGLEKNELISVVVVVIVVVVVAVVV